MRKTGFKGPRIQVKTTIHSELYSKVCHSRLAGILLWAKKDSGQARMTFIEDLK